MSKISTGLEDCSVMDLLSKIIAKFKAGKCRFFSAINVYLEFYVLAKFESQTFTLF